MTHPSLKLALLVRSLSGGGMERIVLTLAGGFAARGHTVDLLVTSAVGEMRSQLPAGVNLVSLAAGSHLTSRLWALKALPLPVRTLLPLVAGPSPAMVRRLPALVRYLRQERPQGLLAAGTQSNLAAIWARDLAGIETRVVVSEHNTLSQVVRHSRRRFRRAYPALARRTYPQADGIAAVSHGVAEDLAQTAGLPAERITTIYNPVVSEDLLARAGEEVDHPWFRDGGPPVVLAVGRLHRQKDYPTLVRAFARVRSQRPVRLLILGEGEERVKIEGLARELGVASDLALPGFADNPFAFMARADLFVLSSEWEGFAVVLVEALACGCPVVSTDCPSGPGEILEGGSYGSLVPVGDHEALAGAILEALSRPADRDRLRARAREFTVGPAVARYLALLADREPGEMI